MSFSPIILIVKLIFQRSSLVNIYIQDVRKKVNWLFVFGYTSKRTKNIKRIVEFRFFIRHFVILENVL